jgi:hypothetical protein
MLRFSPRDYPTKSNDRALLIEPVDALQRVHIGQQILQILRV